MNDKVTFTEKNHKYTGSTGRNYISTTTVIGKYKNPFDSDYWSTYKAIERIVGKKAGFEFFNRVKKEIGYENILPHFLPLIKTPGLLESTRQEILFEWQQKKEEACETGTAYHKKKEEEINSQAVCQITGLPVVINDRELRELRDGIYTELVMWNEEYGIAGQADYVKVYEGIVDIDDYKTSKKIDFVSFKHYEKGYLMMKNPIHNLMDCNYTHYMLQLSVYGWMLEQVGLKVRNLRIYHSREDVYHAVPYRKADVIKMLNHYRDTCQRKETKRINL